MINKIYISTRTNLLKLKAANKHNIRPEDCHIGFILLQALLDDPQHIHQVDVATDAKETNGSVASRTTRLADAMVKSGMQPGDKMVIIASNHLDVTIPFYASHCIGTTLCNVDHAVEPRDLESILSILKPKMVFCQTIHKSHVQAAFEKFDFNGNIVTFDGDDNMEDFISTHRGSDENFSPPIFDQSTTIAWMMLTSGTTGLPKVAMIPFNTLLNGVICWWEKFDDKISKLLAMATIQWMSSLMFFISAPIMQYTRLQSSVPMNPQLLITTINKHKPQATAWIPHMLGRFLAAAGDLCDLSCFKVVVLGGSGIDKELFSKFKAKCKNAYLFVVYGMTELLVPVFDFDVMTPFGSAGQPKGLYEFKLVDEEGNSLQKPFSSGELMIKGDAFFKGYFENPQETSAMLTDDGWLKTGDIFYKDDDDYYYFVERKRLLIRHQSLWISPLQMEEVILRHPGVAEACVVGIPDPQNMELPIGAIACRAGQKVDPEDVFKLIKENLPATKQLFGGMFFMDSLPITASGKVNRSKVKELAFTAQRILPKAL